MLKHLIHYSIRHKLIVLLFSAAIVVFGLFALVQLPIGAVPDITNNQVQIITTSRNLATEDVEQFLTYPVELEMANLPGVQEIRSISKFGLSVVTVIFDDAMGTYLPRQLIAEKIKSAEEKIPQDFGSPKMGPVTTGLGEIYQYTIAVEPQYRDRYSLSDLRTLQDWVIKRQLSGIPGVVEVNTWGGELKTYEVSVNPSRLRALNIGLAEVYQALQDNNNIAGGAYIEKTNESYFIRGEGLASTFEDIETIAVTTRGGRPVLIKDLATVHFGSANRFGAITGNGEGEKVLGQIMMLKDADSNKVIEAVKARVASIQKNLPEGVQINPFLERSSLIAKTTDTIVENLVLGCLIVVLIVILLLGNLRSGLIVASVIPLSLLFSISMMYLFEIDANLMSLGAIDFGIIIDGAVIIVEFIAFSLAGKQAILITQSAVDRRKMKDEIALSGATKMMNSAVFGQLIIILVFIPIFSLSSVEGKMFRPMAQVFCFALLGAMFLCFTYIPVVASLFLKPSKEDSNSISNKLLSTLYRSYTPVLTWALQKKKTLLGIAAGLLVPTAFLFYSMGGEFIPTLDEGDFVIQPVLKTGTTLSKTIDLTTQMEKIILTFPEVKQVVTRIGAAEVPTDPMSMEESDVIITLHPKATWKTADTKDALADQIKEALSVLPGIDFEFTQPIEMRFNELITGVRADLAIKIFGEDLDVLYKKALEVEKAIQDVEGAADIIVEKTAGLPQMTVQYNRNKIAKYGLNITELNQLRTAGFAGITAGTIFEGEKQFDLVLRFDPEYRNQLEDLKTTTLPLPSGGVMPLSEFATIKYSKGPAKISRDNTKRRIVVSVNVRNRDLESVVEDVQKRINSSIELPTGYTIAYGGQFENLRAATARLKIAVPIALFLIFIMLYFAFNSVREAALIFSAIPLASIGGVLALWVRDIPFSISAGVGFIALFGIVVLNGIVLIEEFKSLKKEGTYTLHDLILQGTKSRLRPVLLTASAAALGFFPMALSSSAGAEVQRPLATVVIGGLISATTLTLIVLPVLYALFEERKSSIKSKRIPTTLLLLITIFLLPALSLAQSKPLSAEEAVSIALQNNRGLNAAQQRIEQQKNREGTAFELDKMKLYYNFDENNIDPRGFPLRVFGVEQTFDFPTVYSSTKKLLKQQTALSSYQADLKANQVTKGVLTAYYTLVTNRHLVNQYRQLDSLFTIAAGTTQKRYELGTISALEKLRMDARSNAVSRLLLEANEAVFKSQQSLARWMQSDRLIDQINLELIRLPWKPVVLDTLPGNRSRQTLQQLSAQQLLLEKQNLLPEITLGYFQGSDLQPDSPRFDGVQLGLTVPLWTGAIQSKIKAAKLEVEISQLEGEDYLIALRSMQQSLLSELRTLEVALDHYINTGREQEEELIAIAKQSFSNGEIGIEAYAQYIETATALRVDYLKTLNTYNTTVINLNYLSE
ncbi:MAG: CusA/CzcA family heavy metal efflux RND transporter [Flavobacteriaceae bacterium]